jgi:hypothetical protein
MAIGASFQFLGVGLGFWILVWAANQLQISKPLI